MFPFVGNRLVLHSIRKLLLYFWFQDAFNDKAILENIFLVSYISLLTRDINWKICETSKIFVIMQSAPCDNNYLFWNKSFKKYCFFPNCYMFSSVQKNYYHSYIVFFLSSRQFISKTHLPRFWASYALLCACVFLIVLELCLFNYNKISKKLYCEIWGNFTIIRVHPELQTYLLWNNQGYKDAAIYQLTTGSKM